MLAHDFDCTCTDCYNNIEFNLPKTFEDLSTAKISELAQQEGGLKAYITDCLEKFPRYNKKCNCESRKDGEWLVEDLGDSKYRDVCTRCGGMIK